MLRPFRKGHCKINPKSPTSPPFFDFHPKRIDTKHITHTVSPCSTMKTKTSYFVWYSSRLWIKTSRSKKQIHLFFTRLFGFFTNLPLRGEYRMRLGNTNKNFVFCLVFLSALDKNLSLEKANTFVFYSLIRFFH